MTDGWIMDRFDDRWFDCPAPEQVTHCYHWYDGESCCNCGETPRQQGEDNAQDHSR